MKTVDATGQPKTKGGDSWFVILRDMRSNVKISCRVFDEGDGTVRGEGAHGRGVLSSECLGCVCRLMRCSTAVAFTCLRATCCAVTLRTAASADAYSSSTVSLCAATTLP